MHIRIEPFLACFLLLCEYRCELYFLIKRYRKESSGVRPDDRAGHQILPPRSIQRSGNILLLSIRNNYTTHCSNEIEIPSFTVAERVLKLMIFSSTHCTSLNLEKSALEKIVLPVTTFAPLNRIFSSYEIVPYHKK